MIEWSKLDNDELLTTKQLAKHLQVSESKLNKARMSPNKGPAFVKLESSVRYRVGSVREWIRDCEQKSTRVSFSDGLNIDEMPHPDDIGEWLI